MNKQLLQEVFDVVKNANCNRAVYTTHDYDIMISAKQDILGALKEKWPQEAATLDTTVPSNVLISRRLSTF